MDNSKAVTDWLNSMKNPASRTQYLGRWETWLEYCRKHGSPDSGDLQLEDMKRRRQSTDNSEKYFYDNEIPKFFVYLTTEYKQKITKEPLSENGASGTTTAVRSFFAYHRYSLEIRKESLPSPQKMIKKFEDHAFDIYQLRAMFAQGNLEERTVLSCGKDLWLRVNDFSNLSREVIELLIKRETEKAENEKRQPDIIEFMLTTVKEREPACCHLSKESVDLLNEYLRTYPNNSVKLFPLTEDALNDTLKRLAKKAKITVTGRVRWHCLRKFGITQLHGKVQEPVMKFMVGKHIAEDLRTYIQANNEPYKAFKLIEPLISLTKLNGNNGNSQLAKELEDLKKATFKQMALMKIIEKLTPKEEMQKAIEELAEEFGIKLKTRTKVKSMSEGGTLETYQITEIPDLDTFINKLGETIEKKDLERVLAENGNGNDH